MPKKIVKKSTRKSTTRKTATRKSSTRKTATRKSSTRKTATRKAATRKTARKSTTRKVAKRTAHKSKRVVRRSRRGGSYTNISSSFNIPAEYKITYDSTKEQITYVLQKLTWEMSTLNNKLYTNADFNNAEIGKVLASIHSNSGLYLENLDKSSICAVLYHLLNDKDYVSSNAGGYGIFTILVEVSQELKKMYTSASVLSILNDILRLSEIGAEVFGNSLSIMSKKGYNIRTNSYTQVIGQLSIIQMLTMLYVDVEGK